MCFHQIRDNRQCDSCGIILEPHDFNNTWVGQVEPFDRPSFIAEILKINGTTISMVLDALERVEQVSTMLSVGIKGNRKRGLVFAHIFFKLQLDPYALACKFGLKQKDCIAGVLLYEQSFGFIGWDWRRLLASELASINKAELFDELQRQLLSAKSKKSPAHQIAACINANTGIVCDNFKNIKLDKWKIKRLK